MVMITCLTVKNATSVKRTYEALNIFNRKGIKGIGADVVIICGVHSDHMQMGIVCRPVDARSGDCGVGSSMIDGQLQQLTVRSWVYGKTASAIHCSVAVDGNWS